MFDNMSSIDAEWIKSRLTPYGMEHYLDITLRRTLGAAPHILSVTEIYLDALDKAKTEHMSASDAVQMLKDISQYFIDVRGNICCAVTTALRLITKGIDAYRDLEIDELASYIRARTETYRQLNVSWLEKIRVYGWNVIKDANSILLYDYSSCINAMMETATAHGKRLTVYVPESRSLNGGMHFAANAVKLEQKVVFLPDNAIAWGVAQADMSFIGAETIFPDGGTCNTVGSDMVAILCDYYKKPFYVASQLLKFDARGITGYTQPPHWKHLKTPLANGWSQEVVDNTSFDCPNLSMVKPSLITAYITERGVLPPSAIFEEGQRFLNELIGIEK